MRIDRSARASVAVACAAAVLVTGCAGTGVKASPGGTGAGAAAGAPTRAAVPAIRIVADPYPSTYRAPGHAPTLLRGATVLTGTGERLDGADVLMVDGRIAAVGRGLRAPAGATVVDAAGKWITPGLIDVHSSTRHRRCPRTRTATRRRTRARRTSGPSTVSGRRIPASKRRSLAA